MIAIAAGLIGPGCERGTSSGGEERAPIAETEPAGDDTTAVIDADWVASKFQAPPPPEEKDWAREIERDPIAALKQMDPSALQKRSGAPPRPASRR